jgi:pimeloyl-ACP methyl ester carboxylesterase
VHVATREGDAELFVREAGQGPNLTLLHGYPGSSHDWVGVVERLATRYRVIAPDLLGFGASDKPYPYPYSLRGQADLVEQVWSALDVTETAVVAHDYSTSIAQELLRRSKAPRLTSIAFLNGAVYPALHRPTDGQLALLGPGGDELVALIDKPMWTDAVAATFGPRHPATPDELDALWTAFSSAGGQRLTATLLHYVADRAVDGSAWVDAMESTTVPLAFIWGLSDPVSGAHVLAEVDRRIPGAPIVRLEGIGHWPMIESPEACASAMLEQLR